MKLRDWTLLILLGSALASPASAQPAGRGPGQTPPCQDFMNQKRQLMQQAREWDSLLQKKLDQMNSSQGQVKIDVMASILSDLVEQRHEMHENMMQMQEKAAELKGGCPMTGGMRRGPGPHRQPGQQQ